MTTPRLPATGGSVTRRRFLTRTAAASLCAVPQFIPASARGANGAVAPGDRITVGLIGIGAMGSGHLRVLLGRPDVQLLAVCDPDPVRRDAAAQQAAQAHAARQGTGTHRGCTAHNDYREILARPDIDAVLIATTDHWHSLMAIHAAQAGKDVYLEKPVSLTVREGREMVDNIRRYARVFQTGTQYRSIPAIRQVCEFVRRGGLGKVTAAFTIWGKTHVPTLGPSWVPLDPALPAEPPPAGLDWNIWVGPAAWRPYNSAYHRNPVPGVVPWVFCDAFGAGAITGYHSHAADVIQYAIGMETSGPVEVIHPSAGTFPTLTCRYPNDVLLHHVEGWDQVKSLYHAVPDDARLEGAFGGVLVGERGWLTSMSTGGQVEGGPPAILEEMRMTAREVNVGSNNHHANWLECIRSRARPSSHEEIGHRSASLGHLVAASYRLGRSLRWDPAAEAFPDDPEANRLLARARREPWQA